VPTAERIIPAELNLDLSSLYLGKDKGRFIRNLDYTVVAGEKTGENELVFKPIPANELVARDFDMPAGTNLVIGRYVSRETHEIYVCVWNSLDNHFIYRIRAGRSEMVYHSQKLKFRLLPQHFIGEGRCAVTVVCAGDIKRTFFKFTDSLNTQRFFCVEDAIATDSFNPEKFDRLKGDYDPEELISLGLTAPWGCIEIKEIKTGAKKINKLKKKFLQWRLTYIDPYGRNAEHGVISVPYYQTDCASDVADCLDITFDAGGPLYEKIIIEVNKGGTEWSKYDTIYKYVSNPATPEIEQPWYEKRINSALTYDKDKNTITYRLHILLLDYLD